VRKFANAILHYTAWRRLYSLKSIEETIGQPRRGWTGDVKDSTYGIVAECSRLARDRQQWRTLHGTLNGLQLSAMRMEKPGSGVDDSIFFEYATSRRFFVFFATSCGSRRYILLSPYTHFASPCMPAQTCTQTHKIDEKNNRGTDNGTVDTPALRSIRDMRHLAGLPSH